MQLAPLVAYIRVSTSGQGRSGLGIEVQRHALTQFAEAEKFEVVREFVEVETGKGADALDRRPQLKAALSSDTLRELDLTQNLHLKDQRLTTDHPPRLVQSAVNAERSQRWTPT